MPKETFEVTFDMLKKEFKDKILDVANKKKWDGGPLVELSFERKETIEERKERLITEKKKEEKINDFNNAIKTRICPECNGNLMVSQGPGGTDLKYYCQKCPWQHTMKTFSQVSTERKY